MANHTGDIDLKTALEIRSREHTGVMSVWIMFNAISLAFAGWVAGGAPLPWYVILTAYSIYVPLAGIMGFLLLHKHRDLASAAELVEIRYQVFEYQSEPLRRLSKYRKIHKNIKGKISWTTLFIGCFGGISAAFIVGLIRSIQEISNKSNPSPTVCGWYS